jgi:hypothetical protein
MSEITCPPEVLGMPVSSPTDVRTRSSGADNGWDMGNLYSRKDMFSFVIRLGPALEEARTSRTTASRSVASVASAHQHAAMPCHPTRGVGYRL